MDTELKREKQFTGSAAAKAQTVFRLLLNGYHPRNFDISFWDGSQWPAEGGSPRFTLKVRSPNALRRLLKSRAMDLSLSEAYISGELDIDGDLEAVMPAADYVMNQKWPTSKALQIGLNLLGLPRRNQLRNGGPRSAEISGEQHSVERDRKAVTFHYDLSNDFFALFLDERMVYSCAYFETKDETLDVAQARKLDYVCRKLRLRPGERMLDIGCGWGGLIIHAAREYGVQALGITLSKNQAKLVNERIEHAGLQGKCRVQVVDWRDLDGANGFDKIASVGMFEHVGEGLLPLYFQQAWRLLNPGGVFLNHGIAVCTNRLRGGNFLDRYVFPDTEIVPINVTLRHAEVAGFEVRDVESLREHYALTLRHWAQRLELHRSEALKLLDERDYRVWRLFLRGSAHWFAAGLQNIYQILLVKPIEGQSGLPLTRADWYRPQ
jgi:cyclopropane-fatty-acyl-phospholipid synthase